MKHYNRIAAVTALCMLGAIALAGAVVAANVNPGDLLVLDNDNTSSSRGVYSYSYNVGTSQYDKSTEQKFIDLSALADVTDIAYGPDNNLYIVAGNSVKRYDGTTGAYIDEYATSATSLKNIAFSPTGKAYVDSGVEIYERQSDGSLSLYTSVATYSSIYRMTWGPDNNNDGIKDLYFSGNTWQTGVYVVVEPGDTGTHIAAPPSGYGLYEAFCFGADKTSDGIPEIYAQGEYAGLQVVYHNGSTGVSLGFFTDSLGAYASDMMWGPDNKLYVANRVHGDVKVRNNDGSAAYSFYVAQGWAINNKAYALEFVPGAQVPGRILGKVTLGDYSGDPQYVLVKAELRNPGELAPIRTDKVMLDSQGNYVIADVPVGTYDLAFKAANWLQKIVTPVSVTSNHDTTGVNVTLQNGDADGDNEVTTTDLSVVVSSSTLEGAP